MSMAGPVGRWLGANLPLPPGCRIVANRSVEAWRAPTRTLRGSEGGGFFQMSAPPTLRRLLHTAGVVSVLIAAATVFTGCRISGLAFVRSSEIPICEPEVLDASHNSSP